MVRIPFASIRKAKLTLSDGICCAGVAAGRS